jgi:putative ABC transport system permease protein
VAALTNNFGWSGGALVLSAPTFARAWGGGAVSSLGIQLAGSARPAAVAAAVRAIVGPRSPLLVETAAERVHRARAISRAGLARLSQIAALVLIASGLAMAASMAGLIWQRRPAFAALKIHGTGQGELWRALLLEGALLLGAGCLLGAMFGLIGQLLLDRALQAITGFPLAYAVGLPVALRALALLTLGSVVALALPGWLAVRVRPQTGLAE